MSFVVPTSCFNRLSLGSMGPNTRSQSQGAGPSNDPSRGSFLDIDSDSELSDVSVEDDDTDDSPTIVCSPATRISYDISDLDRETRSEIRQLFQDTSGSDPPQMVLQWCQLKDEQHDGQNYAFQLTETVPRYVRIGSSNSRFAQPRCNCMGDSGKPCRHLMFILDQLDYLTSDSLLNERVRKFGPQGYPTEINHLFEKISDYHLDLLASNLHCDVGSPESNTQPNVVRLQEAQEILATISGSTGDEYAVKHYRPDIFDNHESVLKENGIITYEDLTSTVAKMLITNNDFFAYFLKLLEPNSIARDPFRKIQQHVDRVLEELDRFSHSPPESRVSTVEGLRDVPWAAAHITRAVCTIQYLLQKRADAQRASAARTLIRILYVVIFEWNRNIPQAPSLRAGSSSSSNDQNLYQNLIGSQTNTSSAFILDTLKQLPEQNQWIESLEEIEARLLDGSYGPPATFMRSLRDIISLMRSSHGSTGSNNTRQTAIEEREPGGDAGGGAGSSVAGSKRSSGGGSSGRTGGPKRAR